MSECQFIHFRALDGPLGDEQLALMERQSTRAHVTRWEFTNEYHFGDFRGDVKGMLRNGYDVHLHFANFGIRRLMFRLPAGLPCDQETFKAFVADDGMAWHADKEGQGRYPRNLPGSRCRYLRQLLGRRRFRPRRHRQEPGEGRRLGPPAGGRAVGQQLQASGAGVGRAARGARPGKGARLRAGGGRQTARRQRATVRADRRPARRGLAAVKCAAGWSSRFSVRDAQERDTAAGRVAVRRLEFTL